MANYFKELNEAFDRKFALNNVVESKCRNLVETAEADWDWYEDGFTSPLYRLYGQAFEEAGFDEHADVQSGMGEVYISKKGDPEGMFVANFEDVNDFMNRIHASMIKGKLTDEKKIKDIIFQGVLDISRWRDYPDFENANESFKKSKRKLKEANTDWYSMGWDDQVNAIKRFVKNYRGSKVFEDFAASVDADVDDVIDAFADMESYGVIEIPKEIQIDDKYRNDDIYESKRKKLIKEDLADHFVDAIYDRLLQDVQYKVYDEVMNVASKQVESLPTYRPVTILEANKNYADALHNLAEAAFIKYCVSIRDDEVDEGIVKTLTQPIRDVADTVRDALNIPDKNTKLDEDKGSLGNEIDRYQKWVDFDMSRYGKISERTQQMVNKAGYQIIKDEHGDYEVAAGHFE